MFFKKFFSFLTFLFSVCEFWRKNFKKEINIFKKNYSHAKHIKITNSESVSIDVVEDRSSCISNIETLVGISLFALFKLVISTSSAVLEF